MHSIAMGFFAASMAAFLFATYVARTAAPGLHILYVEN